jgi:hypothetical protein
VAVSNSFRTKTGRCLVDSEHLRIEHEDRGWLATMRDALTTAEIPVWRRAAVVLFYVTLLGGAAIGVRVAPPWLSGAVAGLLLAGVAWSRYLGRNAPTASLAIPREKVVGVDAHDGVPLLTRPRFVVRYRSEGGVKHRYLPCPSRLYGFQAYETGRALFERHGLLDRENGERAVDARDE